MKKTVLLIALALFLCSESKAQYVADAGSLYTSTQLSLSDNQPTAFTSIYNTPMPTTDFAMNDQLNTQQLASRKGWGIACIISGGLTMVSGASVWLFGGMFNNAASAVGSDPEFANDPEMQQGQQAVQAVGNGVKTIGIIGTVAGAALVGTGIWLVSSDGGSYSRGGRSHGRRGGRRGGRRHADLFQQPSIQPDWGLCLNVTPANAGLTLVF